MEQGVVSLNKRKNIPTKEYVQSHMILRRAFSIYRHKVTGRVEPVGNGLAKLGGADRVFLISRMVGHTYENSNAPPTRRAFTKTGATYDGDGGGWMGGGR